MSNHTGLSPYNPTRYLGANVFINTCVTRNREPTNEDFRQPETGKLYPFCCYWLVGKDPTTGTQGDLWYLSKIVANVAYWIKVGTGTSGPLLNVNVPLGVSPIVPDGFGTMTFTSNAGTIAITGSSASPNNHNINFDLVGSGTAIDSVTVQDAVVPGVNPVVADGNGNINVNANLIFAGTNTPFRTITRAVNTYDVELQLSEAVASTDVSANGVAHFDSDDFNVDVNGFVKSKGSQTMPGVQNVGFSYNAGTGTFTVHGQDGMALSASNPAFVTMQDPAAFGELLTIQVTANQDFIDDNGASEIIGNLFGLTTGVATSVDVPFFLYAVMNDAMDHIAFMISRFPNTTTAPVAAKIGMPSTPAADTQGSFFSLENITAADYEGNPCLSIGSFRMRMSTADDWTVQTLAARDGIGHFQEGLQFSFPRGQFGAAAGKVFKNNGTPPAEIAPDDANGGYTYYIDSDNNRIFWQLAFPELDTAGNGAVNAQLALPFNRLEGATNGPGFIFNTVSYSSLISYTIPSTNTVEFILVNDTVNGFMTNNTCVLNSAISLNGTMAIQYS